MCVVMLLSISTDCVQDLLRVEGHFDTNLLAKIHPAHNIVIGKVYALLPYPYALIIYRILGASL